MKITYFPVIISTCGHTNCLNCVQTKRIIFNEESFQRIDQSYCKLGRLLRYCCFSEIRHDWRCHSKWADFYTISALSILRKKEADNIYRTMVFIFLLELYLFALYLLDKRIWNVKIHGVPHAHGLISVAHQITSYHRSCLYLELESWILKEKPLF